MKKTHSADLTNPRPLKDKKFTTATTPRRAKHADNSPITANSYLSVEEIKAVAPVYNEIDNAAQTALYPMGGLNPYGAKAQENLGKMFAMDDAAASNLVKSLGNYHGLKIGRMYAEVDALAQRKGNVSREETHQFFSIIYHMIELPDPILESYRASIKKAMAFLNMGEPLSVEQLQQCQKNIERFSSPEVLGR